MPRGRLPVKCLGFLSIGSIHHKASARKNSGLPLSHARVRVRLAVALCQGGGFDSDVALILAEVGCLLYSSEYELR